MIKIKTVLALASLVAVVQPAYASPSVNDPSAGFTGLDLIHGNAGVEKCPRYKYNHLTMQDDYTMQKCFQSGDVDGNSDLNKSYGNVWGSSHQAADFGKPGDDLDWYDWYEAWLARHKW